MCPFPKDHFLAERAQHNQLNLLIFFVSFPTKWIVALNPRGSPRLRAICLSEQQTFAFAPET